MVLGYHQFNAATFALETFALETAVMQFCWYVFFYCISMLLLPVAAKFSADSLWTDVLLIGLLPVVAFTGLQQLTSAEIPGSVIASMKDWFPCMISGFLFAKYALFENALDKISGKCRSGWGKILLWLLIVGAACIGRSAYPRFSPGRISVLGEWTDLVINMDVFYAPLFVYGAANLLKLPERECRCEAARTHWQTVPADVVPSRNLLQRLQGNNTALPVLPQKSPAGAGIRTGGLLFGGSPDQHTAETDIETEK